MPLMYESVCFTVKIISALPCCLTSPFNIALISRLLARFPHGGRPYRAESVSLYFRPLTVDFCKSLTVYRLSRYNRIYSSASSSLMSLQSFEITNASSPHNPRAKTFSKNISPGPITEVSGFIKSRALSGLSESNSLMQVIIQPSATILGLYGT